jgi:antitoxin MazE
MLQHMQTSLRKLGNSAGVLIPKAFLLELGLDAGDGVELLLEDGRLVMVPVRRQSRAGWAEAAREIAAHGDDALVWPEFTNLEDADLVW